MQNSAGNHFLKRLKISILAVYGEKTLTFILLDGRDAVQEKYIFILKNVAHNVTGVYNKFVREDNLSKGGKL